MTKTSNRRGHGKTDDRMRTLEYDLATIEDRRNRMTAAGRLGAAESADLDLKESAAKLEKARLATVKE